MPPSSWLVAPSGLMTSFGVGGAPDLRDADALVDLDFGDDGCVGGEVLVARKGDATAFYKAAARGGPLTLPLPHWGRG